jgi:hypothetical protein
MINLISLERRDTTEVRAIVSMPVEYWRKESGSQLWRDIGNKIYEVHGLINTLNPTIDESRRAKNGIKQIVIYYKDSEWQPIQSNVISMSQFRKTA